MAKFKLIKGLGKKTPNTIKDDEGFKHFECPVCVREGTPGGFMAAAMAQPEWNGKSIKARFKKGSYIFCITCLLFRRGGIDGVPGAIAKKMKGKGFVVID